MKSEEGRHGAMSLGATDLQVGDIGYGCWRVGELTSGQLEENICTALDSGMNLVDTADIYGPEPGHVETALGRVLKRNSTLRQEVIIATKGGIQAGVPYNSGREYLVAACEMSLQRLGRSTIDLYQIHRPDLLTHPEEVAEALTDLRDSGKIQHAGVSNYRPIQVRNLQKLLPFPLASHQFEFSLLEMSAVANDVLDQCIELSLGCIAWSPLAGGRILQSSPPENGLLEYLKELGARHGVAATAVALAFVMRHPARPVPLVGSTQPQRIADAANARNVQLSRAEWYRLYELASGSRLP